MSLLDTMLLVVLGFPLGRGNFAHRGFETGNFGALRSASATSAGSLPCVAKRAQEMHARLPVLLAKRFYRRSSGPSGILEG